MPIVFQSFFSCFTRTHEQTEKWRSTAYSANQQPCATMRDIISRIIRIERPDEKCGSSNWALSFLQTICDESIKCVCECALLLMSIYWKSSALRSHTRMHQKSAVPLGVCVCVPVIYILYLIHTQPHTVLLSVCVLVLFRFVSFRFVWFWCDVSNRCLYTVSLIALRYRIANWYVCARLLTLSLCPAQSRTWFAIVHTTHNTMPCRLTDWLAGWPTRLDSTRLA